MNIPEEILALIERERSARKQAESLLESKSKELHDKKEELELLNVSLEEEILARTEKIKRREEQLLSMFNHYPFPSLVYDIETLEILTVNNAAVHMYGYSLEEFSRLRITDLHPEDELTKLDSYLDNVRSGNSKPDTWTHLLKNGNKSIVKITGNSIAFSDRDARIVTIEDITEKAKIQEELEEKERQFKDLVEKTSDVIYRTDMNGEIVYTNPNCLNITGFTSDEILGKNFSNFISDSYRERVSNFYKYQYDKKIPTTKTEFPVKKKNGEEIWVEQTVDLISIANNNYEFVIVARDITEKRILEKSLIRSEEKYRSIIENMELGLLEVDTEDRILRAYPKFCKLTGYSEDELLGKTAADIFLDEDMMELMNQEKNKRKTGITSVYEVQIKKKDGSKVWVMISGAPYFDEKNKIVGSVGVHLDISERKLTEKQLELLSQFPELNPYPVIRYGLEDSELIYANKHGKEFLTWMEFDSEIQNWTRWFQFIKGEFGTFCEFTWNDRTYRFNRVMEAQLGIINIYSTDITEIKELQKELLDAKEKAEILSQSKDLFLANMSHEIRTPMNAIIGLSEVLADSKLDNFQFNTLNKVRTASESLLHLINEILDLSKIESNSFKLSPSYSNLNQSTRECFELFENVAAKKDVELIFKSNLNSSTLFYFDKNRLNQVLTNLIGNALKFTERGQVILEVKEQILTNSDNSAIQFSVIDTGIGIPPSDLQTIFENFSQAANNDTIKYGGTGLGLSIAKKILDLMDSQLHVESVIGEGSVFKFTIQLKHTQELISAMDNIVENTSHDLSEIQILVAEDNQTNQFLIQTILEKNGAKVTIANNGLEALEFIENKTFDLILMDMRMPKLDGVATSWTIRNKLKNTTLPIIALTANSSDKDKEACFEAGMNDFVIKPFSQNALISTIVRNINFKGSLLDLNKLNDATFNDEEFKNKMISIFIKDTEDRIVQIEKGLSAGDFDEIRKIAHSIKPALHHISSAQMAELANNVENGHLDSEETFVEQARLLVDSLKRILIELDNLSQNGK